MKDKTFDKPHLYPPMPKVEPRRPFDDEKPNGYEESLNDWFLNNTEAVEWFLENAEVIRACLNAEHEPRRGTSRSAPCVCSTDCRSAVGIEGHSEDTSSLLIRRLRSGGVRTSEMPEMR